MIQELLAVIGVFALMVLLLPPFLSLLYHPKLTIPGSGLYERWMDYWVEKSIEWERSD